MMAISAKRLSRLISLKRPIKHSGVSSYSASSINQIGIPINILKPDSADSSQVQIFLHTTCLLKCMAQDIY
jgi:hypothetical protein